jgi:protein-disulfide isomerase
MIDAIYRRQASMFEPGNAPKPILRDIARTVAGMSPAVVDACLADQKGLAAVNARNDRHLNVDKIDSTPTFFVNGRRLADELAPGDLAKALHGPGR